MIRVVALGEVLIDFASRGTDANGYPLMQTLAGGVSANFSAALTKFRMPNLSVAKDCGNGCLGQGWKNTLYVGLAA